MTKALVLAAAIAAAIGIGVGPASGGPTAGKKSGADAKPCADRARQALQTDTGDEFENHGGCVTYAKSGAPCSGRSST